MNTSSILPDQNQRDSIRNDLDACMLVEAAAGTGKTTEMVARMIALLREGRCTIDKMAAITFTRKAAAEMRSRFQARLEEEARNAKKETKHLLQSAAVDTGKCCIGTIHSFCARLLRERPVEAQVPLDFSQLEDDEDERLRLEAWDRYCARLFAENNPILDRMNDLGMDISELRQGFVKFADYPDVGCWPRTPPAPLPDVRDIHARISAYLNQTTSQVLAATKDAGSDQLLQLYEKLPFLVARTDWNNLASVERLLKKFDRKEAPTTRQSPWPGESRAEKNEIRASEEDRWADFRDQTARPFLRNLYAHRYREALDAYLDAGHEYNRLRRGDKALNFEDLLMKAAALLRDGGGGVRRYFQNRFTHLLVDEFQDTDPLQAQVMLLLSAADTTEKDWEQCTPRPGSLFIVGDPKQSIYRFRRADLVTYNKVRSIMSRGSGRVIRLSANFRSTPPVLEWVNRSFSKRFPDRADDRSPSYVPLRPGRESSAEAPEHCVERLVIPDEISKGGQEQVVEYEAGLIAAYIREALHRKMKIKCPKEGSAERAVRPSDFMIVTWKKNNMSRYAQKLDQFAVPNAVTGGTVLNEVREINHLYQYMQSLIHPHDPVSLVAALRSELFGVDDGMLYAFKKNGGKFDWRHSIPGDLDPTLESSFRNIFEHFRRHHLLCAALPAVAAIQRIAGDLGLKVMASASAGGNVQAGSLEKTYEILRSARTRYWSLSRMVDYLGELAASEEPHDGLPARPLEHDPVRIMNLHKVKGLQAPIVFLADPNGYSDHPPEFHIDRQGPGEACGYLNLKKSGGYRPPPLAQPGDWEEKWAVRESGFGRAETQRLLYVAATRAEIKLIISQRGKYKNRNPWNFFEDNLADRPQFPGAEAAEPPSSPQAAMGDKEMKKLRKKAENIELRRRLLMQPGHLRERAKPDLPAPDGIPGTEYGTEWGNVLHTLLEARMSDPEIDLRPLALSSVRSRTMPSASAGRALELVHSLTSRSGSILDRALNSEHRLTEVPFTYRKNGTERPPVVVSGIIDLVFKERDGWVIVDYKTDRAARDERGRKALTENYRDQIIHYTQAWIRCSGEQLKEAGIYYTAAGIYVPVNI